MSPLAWAALTLLGGVGAVLRFGIDGVVSVRREGEFPLGTFVIKADDLLR